MGERKVIASISETRSAITDIFNQDVFQHMFKYGIYRLKSKFSIKYDIERGFRGLMMDDLIGEVIASFADGKRKWNRTDFPNFKDQLFSAFDSHICNTVKKEFEKVIDTDAFDENHVIVEENSSNSTLIGVVMDILEKIGCTPEEILIFEPFFISKMKRVDVADTLGVSVEEITNAKKRLDRRLPELRTELKKMGYEE